MLAILKKIVLSEVRTYTKVKIATGIPISTTGINSLICTTSQKATLSSLPIYHIAREDEEGILRTLMEGLYQWVDDVETLDQYAWFIYENYDETGYLQEAALWAEKSIEIERVFSNLETYAALLHKLDRRDKSHKVVELALEISTQDDDTDFVRSLLSDPKN